MVKLLHNSVVIKLLVFSVATNQLSDNALKNLSSLKNIFVKASDKENPVVFKNHQPNWNFNIRSSQISKLSVPEKKD